MLRKLSKALPFPGRALVLRTNFNRSLVDSLKYLMSACEEVVPVELFSKAIQKLESLNVNSKFSGFLGAIHLDLFNAIERNDVQHIKIIIENFTKYDFEVNEIKYINISNVNEYYTPILKDRFSQELPHPVEYFSFSSEQFERVKQSLEEGFKVIQRISPNFYEECQTLIAEVVLLNAKGLKGGSSAELFGTIYLSYTYKWEKLTDAIDLIIHELSHLYVHLLAKDDHIVLNALERYESPLRKEKRPLIGVYHATFVLARIVYVLREVLSFNGIPAVEKEYCLENIDYYEKRCRVGLEVLNNHAQMTPLGRELILSAGKLLDEISPVGAVA